MAKANPCDRCGTVNPALVCDFCGGCAECASRVEDGKRKCLACIRKDAAGPDWKAIAARLAEALRVCRDDPADAHHHATKALDAYDATTK